MGIKITDYFPDKWVVIKISIPEESIYKVFGSWIGGYLSGDSWRMNSGIESVSLNEDLILFKGFSGSIYHCHKDSYGTTAFSGGVLLNMIDKTNGSIVILDENTNWLNLDLGAANKNGTTLSL